MVTSGSTFFADHDCRAPYFVEISKEFVEYLANELAPERHFYPFMAELAHYEWLELEISVRKSAELTLWQPGDEYQAFAFSPLAELVSYQWPVHQISSTYLPDTPANEPFYFVVFRNLGNEVTFSQINQVTAHLVNCVAQQEECLLADLQAQIRIDLPQFPAEQMNAATQQIVEQMLSQEIFVLR